MLTTNDYLFGNHELHEQMRGATQVLVMLAEHGARPARIEDLCAATGRAERDVSRLCRALEQAGLLRKPAPKRREWALTCDPNALTLETVYLCMLDEATRQVRHQTAPEVADRSLHRVDVLLSQAAMTVHQSVLAHLRQFSIGTIRRRESREATARTRWDRFEARVSL